MFLAEYTCVINCHGCEVTEDHIGIWLGAEKGSQHLGHYPQGTVGHGVHTLMKGFADRLEKLAEQVEAPLIIIMEGDCWPVENSRL